MKRLFFWSFLFVFAAGVNVYLYFYSDTMQDNRYKEQPMVKAVQLSGNTPEEFITTENNSRLELIFTGDVMLGRTVMTKSIEMGDYLYLFRKTAGLLSEADLTVINLENPIISDCPIHTDGFRFCSEPESVSAITYAGADIANLANNHIFNWGQEGLQQTIIYLEQGGVDYTGHGHIAYKQVKDMKLAFVGFDFVTKPYQLSADEIDLIKLAQEGSDILIINVHWGNEYKASANDNQRSAAKRLITLGADLIVGHHPHWVQDIDCFALKDDDWKVVKNIEADDLKKGERCGSNTKPVYYSLGNFVFDQMWSEETKKGVAVKIIFDDGEFLSHIVHPIYIKKWAQPVWDE